MLGGVNGNVRTTRLQVSPPPWRSRAPQAENGLARGLSDRAKRGSSAAPVFCRGAQGNRSAAEIECPEGARTGAAGIGSILRRLGGEGVAEAVAEEIEGEQGGGEEQRGEEQQPAVGEK